jgi:hypothetical protein
MADVFYLNFNEQEASETVRTLEAAGHTVRLHWDTQSTAKFDGWLPQAAVISLERLPSHGRAYAEWLWEPKYRRTIPILFVGGRPDKVEATRQKFPAAIYCSHDEMICELGKALA